MSENIASDYSKIIDLCVRSEIEQITQLKLRDIRILVCLNLYDIPLIPAKIAALLKYDAATVTRSMRVLSQRALVIKKPDPLDKRSIQFSIADEGIAIATFYTGKVIALFERLSQEVGSSLSRQEKLAHLNATYKLNKRSAALLLVAKRLQAEP